MFRGVGDFPFDPTDQLILWHIPREGCAKKADIIEQCHLISAIGNYTLDEMTQDSDTNMTDTETLEDTNKEEDIDTEQDTDTEEPGIVITESLADAAKLYLSEEHRGRLITFVRDPVEREFAHFIELRNANNNADPGDENFNPAFKDMKLEGYVNSDYVSMNWFTRNLLGLDDLVFLRQEHFERAKFIMREKMLVLLVDEMDESISHLLEKYFESSGLDSGSKLDCIGNVIEEYSKKYIPIHTRMIPHYSHEYSMIAHHNNFDVQLYRYARQLFTEQHLKIDRQIEFLRMKGEEIEETE